MIIKAILAPLMVARCMARLGFVAGAMVGTAGVVGLCALRRAVDAKRAERPVTTA
ncbi:MAG: hypothetical protein NTW56_09260 [Alphaproteobacteria bacterium]|nr:hypothetical protein [Alphaproteobacteria bacterium]